MGFQSYGVQLTNYNKSLLTKRSSAFEKYKEGIEEGAYKNVQKYDKVSDRLKELEDFEQERKKLRQKYLFPILGVCIVLIVSFCIVYA